MRIEPGCCAECDDRISVAAHKERKENGVLGGIALLGAFIGGIWIGYVGGSVDATSRERAAGFAVDLVEDPPAPTPTRADMDTCADACGSFGVSWVAVGPQGGVSCHCR